MSSGPDDEGEENEMCFERLWSAAEFYSINEDRSGRVVP